MAQTPPDGFNNIIPYLVVTDGAAAIPLYENVFDAETFARMDMPGTSKVMHAVLQIGSSKFFLSDANPEMGMAAPENEVGVRLYVYVGDVDAVHAKAVASGFAEIHAPETMFWGDRTAVLEDPWKHRWTIATHVKDVSTEELAETMKKMAT